MLNSELRKICRLPARFRMRQYGAGKSARGTMKNVCTAFFSFIAAASVSVGAANATHDVPKDNAAAVCSHHGGMRNYGNGSRGCSWCGTKYCTFITCNDSGCSQTTLPTTSAPPKGTAPVTNGKPVQAPPPPKDGSPT